EDDIVAGELSREVGLLDVAAQRVRASADHKQVVHAAIGRSIRVADETRLANRPVCGDEWRYDIPGAFRRGDRHLWIGRRARAAAGGLAVAAAAAVEIEARSQAVRHRFRSRKVVRCSIEESLLRGAEAGKRTSSAGIAAAHARINGAARCGSVDGRAGGVLRE